MSEQRPAFVARKNPGSGWVVDILWPDGDTEVIKGFITEHNAAKWIAEHSEALQEITNDKPPQDSPG
jgi:hypothetical protein